MSALLLWRRPQNELIPKHTCREVSALSWWMGSVPPTATSCVSPKAPRVAVRGLVCVLVSPLNDELLGHPPSSPNLQSFILSFRGYFL